jgi:hypothetical protein
VRARFLADALVPVAAIGLALAFVERSVPYHASLAWTLGVCAASLLLGAPFALHALRLARRLDDARA